MIEVAQHPVLLRVARSGRRSNPRPGYLLSTPDADAGEAASLWLAAAFNCPSDGDTPCGTCPSCRRIESGNHPDVVSVAADGAFIKVDQIRELIGQLSFQRHDARYRVARILGAELMRAEAANAMLKVLEEPPDGTTIILVTTNAAGLLSTLRSRCQDVHLNIPPEHIRVRKVAQERGLDEATAAQLVRWGGTDADEEVAQERLSHLEMLLAGWDAPVDQRLLAAQELASDKDTFKQLLADLFALCRDLAALRVGISNVPSPHKHLAALDRHHPDRSLDVLADFIGTAEGQLKRNVQGRLIAEALLLSPTSLEGNP